MLDEESDARTAPRNFAQPLPEKIHERAARRLPKGARLF
jgi:hypothetical protein